MLGLKLWYPDTLNAPFHSRLKAYIPERKRRRIKYRFQCNLQNDSSRYQPMLHHGKKTRKMLLQKYFTFDFEFHIKVFHPILFFVWNRFRLAAIHKTKQTRYFHWEFHRNYYDWHERSIWNARCKMCRTKCIPLELNRNKHKIRRASCLYENLRIEKYNNKKRRNFYLNQISGILFGNIISLICKLNLMQPSLIQLTENSGFVMKFLECSLFFAEISRPDAEWILIKSLDSPLR